MEDEAEAQSEGIKGRPSLQGRGSVFLGSIAKSVLSHMLTKAGCSFGNQ